MGRTLSWILAAGAGALVTALVLYQCAPRQSDPGPDAVHAGLCRVYLKERLLNPETARFAEFTKLSQEQYIQRLMAAAFEDRRIPADIAASVKPRLEEMTRQLAADMASTGAQFYEYRVRAEGPLGNVVTALQYCAANTDQCVCISAEDYRERFRP